MWILCGTVSRPVLKEVKTFTLEPAELEQDGKTVPAVKILDKDASDSLDRRLVDDLVNPARIEHENSIAELGTFPEAQGRKVFKEIVFAARAGYRFYQMPDIEESEV